MSTPRKNVTAPVVSKRKTRHGDDPLVMVTAYDYHSSRLADEGYVGGSCIDKAYCSARYYYRTRGGDEERILPLQYPRNRQLLDVRGPFESQFF